jgi:light-regulated signal transduction histidine kinase (bacteriophytochrome)
VAKKPTYEELEQRVEELEKRVSERQRSMTKLEERASQQEQSCQQLKESTRSVPNDLQRPLDRVMSYLRFVEARYKGRLGPDADAFIASAVEGAEEIQRIIADLQIRSRDK